MSLTTTYKQKLLVLKEIVSTIDFENLNPMKIMALRQIVNEIGFAKSRMEATPYLMKIKRLSTENGLECSKEALQEFTILLEMYGEMRQYADGTPTNPSKIVHQGWIDLIDKAIEDSHSRTLRLQADAILQTRSN
jgi:hypothetical protein